MLVSVLALGALGGVSSPASGAGRPTLVTGPTDARSVPEQLLVGYRRGATWADRAEARRRAGAELIEEVVRAGADRTAVELVVVRGVEREEAMRRFTSNPTVDYAEPNWIYTHDATSNDPYFTNESLWGMYGDVSSPANQYGSQAAEAWSAGHTGSNTVYVGIIDEGVDHRHPDLDGNMWVNPFDPADGVDNDGNGYVDDIRGWDFNGNNNTTYDGKGDDHGTHVAGTIGAEGGNGIGVAGVAWNVELITVKFLGQTGGTTANAVKAVDYLTDLKTRHGLNIVASNNSWGGGGYSTSLYGAIERAKTANILFIAAAGNSGVDTDSSPHYPSSYNNANIVSVASITSGGAKSSWSNYGETSVDLGAPGSGIYSTLPENTYGSYSGTSMATPHVTGAIALYRSVHAASAANTKSAVLGSVVATASLAGTTVTGGRLNASDLLGGSSGGGGGTTTTTTAPVTTTTTTSPSSTTTTTTDPSFAGTVSLASGTKRKGVTPVTATWSGFGPPSVTVSRGGTTTSEPSTGSVTDDWRGSGTITYTVCETERPSNCASASITI